MPKSDLLHILSKIADFAQLLKSARPSAIAAKSEILPRFPAKSGNSAKSADFATKSVILP